MGALPQLQEAVRANPGDAKLRIFLFQLLSVLGQWERALNQLNVSAEIDPNTLAAGARLADGVWDLYVHFGVLGVAMRGRATLTQERRPGQVVAERVQDGPPTMAAYFTQRTSGLSLDVGLLKHPKLRAQPAKKPLAGRMVRRLRRMLVPA